MKPKKEKIVPIILHSRETMEAAVADIVRLKLEHARLTIGMEDAVAVIQKAHQEQILAVARQIEINEASVYMFCQDHRAELFPDKKSIDTLLAEVGFRFSNHSVEKHKKGDTWIEIVLRLQATDWGKDYIREPDPELDKKALIADRTALDEHELKKVGIYIAQEENFYIEPKSQIATRTVKEAA